MTHFQNLMLVNFGGEASGAEEGLFASDAGVFRPQSVDGDEVLAILDKGEVGDCWCRDVPVVYWIAATDTIVDYNLKDCVVSSKE